MILYSAAGETTGGSPSAWTAPPSASATIVQHKALTPNDFGSLDELSERLLAFQARYSRVARPFEWTFTRSDSTACLPRSPAASRI